MLHASQIWLLCSLQRENINNAACHTARSINASRIMFTSQLICHLQEPLPHHVPHMPSAGRAIKMLTEALHQILVLNKMLIKISGVDLCLHLNNNIFYTCKSLLISGNINICLKLYINDHLFWFISVLVCNKLSTEVSLVEKNGNAMLWILFIANTLVKYLYWPLWENNIEPQKCA